VSDKPAAAEWEGGLGEIHARREAIWLALAAAELCWLAPAFWTFTWNLTPHPPLLLWLGLLVLMLGFFFFYRALASAGLELRLQQGLLAAGLVLCIGLVLRFHVLAGSGLGAADWLLMPFRDIGVVPSSIPLSWVAIMLLIYLWARAIHLANRSLSAEAVGFSFRSGVVVLIAVAFFVQVFTGLDASGFVAAYFFFALTAVALARVEEVSRLPNSARAPFSGFWIGSTVGAVGLLVLLGGTVVLILTGGGLEGLLRLLAPLLEVVQTAVIAAGMLLVLLVEWLLGLFRVDLTKLGDQLREVMSRLNLEPVPLEPSPESEAWLWPIIERTVQVLFTVALPATIVALILYVTWRRRRQRSGEEGGDESRELLLSGGALAGNLRAMLRGGLDRLGELAGMVRRFGPGARLLAAMSIRRIYGQMVRLATEAGYPRNRSQTPYEYLPALCQAYPGYETEVATITEAYVNAHYGQVPDSGEELQRIRDCWERARSQERGS